MKNEDIFKELQVLKEWELEDSIRVTFLKNEKEVSTFVIGYEDCIEITLEADNCIRVWSIEGGTQVPTMARILCDYVKSVKLCTEEEAKELHGFKEKLMVLEMENNETIEFSTAWA